ncbi:MAG: hypothetical protein HY011_29815 [Acidobacteria bacterium]|nr:hypothetical protein [Acidobacteriota bacterium]
MGGLPSFTGANYELASLGMSSWLRGQGTGRPIGGQQGGEQQKQPCDAQAPTDPNIYAGVVTAMHEHTAFQYANGDHREFTNAARVNLGTEGDPARAASAAYRTGDVINFQTLMMEAAAFATAIHNSFAAMQSNERQHSREWPTWEAYLRNSGRFGGDRDWERGRRNLGTALTSSADSVDCAYLKGVTAIFSSVYSDGQQSLFYRSNTVSGWLGVFQPPFSRGGNFFLRAPSGTRIGDHDFIP